VAAALEALESDARAHGDIIAVDLETAPRPGHGPPRPALRINKDGALAAIQPAFTDRTALDPHRAEIRLLQLYAEGETCFLFTDKALAALLDSGWLRQQHLVAHGADFECAFLHYHARNRISVPGPDKPQGRLECSKQAAGLITGVGYGGSARSLEDASTYFLGKAPPKELQTSDWAAIHLSQGQLAYAASDAVLAWRIWQILAADLERNDRWGAYELQRRAIPGVVAMQLAGLGFDRDEHARQVETWKQALTAARRQYLGDTGKPPPSTPNQVRDWLTAVLPPDRLAHWPRTETSGQLSIEGKHLKRLLGLPGTAPVLRLLVMEKLLSTFGPKLVEQLNPVTGRLHPNFIISGAKSGRFTCSHPNLQQLPAKRAPEFRRCIVAAPGHLLIGCDWNQIELRAAAWISGDPELTRIYEEGLDLHKEMASQIAGVPLEQISREQRSAAKPVSFGAIYGIGPRSLAEDAFYNYDVEMSEAEAKDALEQFFNRFHVLNDWRQENYQHCVTAGAVRIGCGRVVEAAWVPGGRLSFPQCCNLPVQGICADAMLRAVALTHNRLTRAKIAGSLVATVHDELLLEVREEQAEAACELLHRAMLDAFELTFPGAPTTLVAEATIGRSWAGLKDGAAPSSASSPIPTPAPSSSSSSSEAPQATAAPAAAARVAEILTHAVTLTWDERIEHYTRVIKKDAYMGWTTAPQADEDWEPDLQLTGRWVHGTWLLGQFTKIESGYYGGFPGNLLKRVGALFPDKRRVLHICAGMVDLSVLPGDTLDINPELQPTYCCDAETCDSVPLDQYDLIIIDPPYTGEDAEHYGVPLLKRDKVMKILAQRLSPGCHVIWVDQLLPRYSRQAFTREAVIGLSISTSRPPQ
jgi:DNA polymerase-1